MTSKQALDGTNKILRNMLEQLDDDRLNELGIACAQIGGYSNSDTVIFMGLAASQVIITEQRKREAIASN